MLRNCAAGLVSLLLSHFTQAQMALHVIEPIPLEISYAQTSNIVFPYAIESVDRGSAQVLAQQAKGVKNILQLKAARRHFPMTNVSVVTSDGKLYSFVIQYAEYPQALNVEILKDTKAQLALQPIPSDNLSAIARSIDTVAPHFPIRINSQFLRLQLRNVFFDSASMWFSFRITNYSAVDFHPKLLRFYVKEKKQPKRTAVQEKYLYPLYCEPLPPIRHCFAQSFQVAFAPFTIKRSQRFYVQIGERSGARLLTLPIKYKTLLKARPLP
jgi:conjugative transposon TraN protein